MTSRLRPEFVVYLCHRPPLWELLAPYCWPDSAMPGNPETNYLAGFPTEAIARAYARRLGWKVIS
jgi:hypothetical protein